MQIFIRLLTGKTISMDVKVTTLLSDIIEYANEYHKNDGLVPYQYQKIMVISDYDNQLTVSNNRILEPTSSLISLYSNNIIKEVVFLVL